MLRRIRHAPVSVVECRPPTALVGDVSTSSSLSVVSATATALLPTLLASQRFLRVAKTPFGYYRQRHGQSANHWPFYRQFWTPNNHAGKISPPYHWRQFAPYDPNTFLPKANYVTGQWTGLCYVPLDQVYTLQHCTANVPLKVKRFPTTFEYKQHSRWMLGKAVKTWVEPRAHIFDEAALTKRARLNIVKKGLLPPG